MAKAFLSHSSFDKNLISAIATQLGRNNCHYDSLTFEAGEKTLDEIFSGLEDTDVFVLFISNDSLESKWVRKEISGAKRLSSKKVIDRIFPLIIDKNITHKDSRIPDWIKKPYNIQYFDNEVLILKKIRQFLRESTFKKYSHLKDVSELFVGRNDLIQEFERKVINLENKKPTCIIASSFFEGIGRRTFITNGLIKTRIIDKWYVPLTIPISSKESIEDFIYKLNFVRAEKEIFEYDFAKKELSEKIEIAVTYIKKFVDNGEIIFVVDEGSIVLPNHQIVEWFKSIIRHESLSNQVSIGLISKYKPQGLLIRKMNSTLHFQVDELSKQDTQTLFIQYLNIIGRSLKPVDSEFFLDYLKGIPGQVIYAINLIETLGINEAKKYVDDIEEFDEIRALSILEFIKDDELSKQILIALSKFEIISYNLVFRIFGESEEVSAAMQKLYDLSLFFSVSSTHDYLKLNTSISDYINRSRLNLNSVFSENLRLVIKEGLAKPLELNEYSDYSEFLLTLQAMIRSGDSIPSRYFIPSFICKSIVQEYYDRHYKTVVSLAKRILENAQRFDSQIIRETRNWLCLAYCRTKDNRFFDEIGYFKDIPNETMKDYYFLLGFYYRNSDRMEDAEFNFMKVLEIDKNHSRTKRELVNVYLRKGDYMKALNWAEENYKRFRSNILHIQAYFTCLIKKHRLTARDHEILQELLTNAQKSIDKRANDMHQEMLAEYDFYVRGNYQKAIRSLEESLRINGNNYFTFKALLEIYRRQEQPDKIEALELQYPHLVEVEFE